MENVVFLTITYNMQAKIISDNLTAAGFKVVPLGIDIDYDDDREGRNRLMESQLLAELPQAKGPVAIVTSNVCCGEGFGYYIASLAQEAKVPTLTIIWSNTGSNSSVMDRYSNDSHEVSYVNKNGMSSYARESAEMADQIARFLDQHSLKSA